MLALIPALMVISQSDIPAETQAVIDAERAFARMAREKSRKEAFLANMDRDSILFHPGPVSGIEVTEKQIKGVDLLAWAPVYADSSLSGDLGFTTGPWTYQDNPKGPIRARGYYFTIWRKTADGYKMVLDCGAPVAGAADLPTEVEVPKTRGKAAPTGASMKLIGTQDEELNRAIEAQGLEKAVAAVAEEEIHAEWPLEPFLAGKEAATKMLGTKPSFKDYKTLSSGMSKAGDFAYAYGNFVSIPKAADKKPATGHYVRIWRRDESANWRLFFLLTMAPPPE